MSLLFKLPFAVLGLYFSCRYVDGLSTGKSMARREDVPELTESKINRFIVIPEHNLLFCYMEKVGCTNFNTIFKRLRSRYDPEQAEGSVWYRNTPQVHGLTKDDVAKILGNKTWHKAVFYRDPVERFVSAYASKCGHVDTDGANHCLRQFGKEELPFEDAVQWIADYDARFDEENRFDEHWLRQSTFCGGLGSTLQYYDTVEELDVATANEKVSKMLKAVNVDPQSIEGFDVLFPPTGGKEALPGSGTHATDVEDSMDEYFPPGTVEQRMRVLTDHYKVDYEAFGISMPSGVSLLRGLPNKLHWPLLPPHVN